LSNVRIDLDIQKLMKLVEKDYDTRLRAAGAFMTRYAKQLVSKGPGRGARGKRGGKGKSLRFKSHSKPGQPPFVQTGMLRQSITFEIVKDGAFNKRLIFGVRKGTADNYARALELGSGRMAPRPFLRPTLTRNLTIIRRMLGVYK